MIVALSQPDLPVLELLEKLARQAGSRLDVSAGAKRTLADRSLRVSLKNSSLIDFLEQLADNFELACRVEGDVIQLAARAELDPKLLKQAQRLLASHTLRVASREERRPSLDVRGLSGTGQSGNR